MTISKRLRFDVLRRCGFRCFYCGAPAAEAQLHVDHRVPKARGGSDDPANLVPACRDCNLGKGTGPARDYGWLDDAGDDFWLYDMPTLCVIDIDIDDPYVAAVWGELVV